MNIVGSSTAKPAPMHVVRLSYPHCAETLRPARLRAQDIWRIAADARRQICPHQRRPKVEVCGLIARTRRFVINGCELDTEWDSSVAVRDHSGALAYGVTQYDPERPGTVTVHLNGGVLSGAEDLIRSTALHELGHVVFDAPSWTVPGSYSSPQEAAKASTSRRFSPAQPTSQWQAMDWAEWRANEFMGAFLAPRNLLHSWAVKRAACLGLRLEAGLGQPVVSVRSHIGLDALALELAELFGLSEAFIAARLRRYGIVDLSRQAA